MKFRFSGFQQLGRALMLPIAVLPIAGLLLRLGQPDLLNWVAMAAAGKAVFSNLGLLFAVGVGGGAGARKSRCRRARRTGRLPGDDARGRDLAACGTRLAVQAQHSGRIAVRHHRRRRLQPLQQYYLAQLFEFFRRPALHADCQRAVGIGVGCRHRLCVALHRARHGFCQPRHLGRRLDRPVRLRGVESNLDRHRLASYSE